MAAFDAKRLRLAGEPFPVADKVAVFGALPGAAFSAAGGSLVYRTGSTLRLRKHAPYGFGANLRAVTGCSSHSVLDTIPFFPRPVVPSGRYSWASS